MNKFLSLTVLFTTSIALAVSRTYINATKAGYSLAELEDQSFKSVMDMKSHTHLRLADHIVREKYNGVAPKGEALYKEVAQSTGDIPELGMIEDALNGFLAGTSFSGNQKCQAAMQGCIYYAFEVIYNRNVADPAQVMKAVIAAQKLQAQTTLFSQ